MDDTLEGKLNVIKTKIPKTCVCPTCGKRQPFKRGGEYITKRKDLDLDHPIMVIIQRVRAKCLNPSCKRKRFVLPIQGVEKYQRCISRVKEETINKNILENVTYRRISRALSRSFNVTGSRSSIDRWKQREADKYSFKDIIKEMRFSGALSLDEYKPKRSNHYDLIAGDAKRVRILYMESAPFSPRHAGSPPRGDIKGFCYRLKQFGITPYTIIVDLCKAFPKQIRQVWPGVLIQFDHYHVQQIIHRYLRQLLFGFIRRLRKTSPLAAEELWERRWRIVKNMDRWNIKDHEIIPQLMEVYADTPVEQIFILKERIHDIFNVSTSKKEAYEKRDNLCNETWWRSSWHLTQVVRFLMRPDFENMVMYLDKHEVPRCGNIETLIRSWRQMEKVRYGFASEKGRQNHLKLYQVKHYLNGKVGQNMGQPSN